uniref:Flagellar protein FliL n=1 Tax=Globodera pallida TaxID=36090 RepID=A0A183CB67_GLOPA
MASKHLPLLGGAALIAAVSGFWLTQRDAGRTAAAPAAGAVVITSTTPVAASSPSPAPPAPANLPTAPDKVIAHVRQAYPLLEKVDFSCDAKGCAVTATIPPPTGEEFLRKRQEMLLGGLARLAEADGYRMPGPVQMEEIESNLFHIRADVVPARRPGS